MCSLSAMNVSVCVFVLLSSTTYTLDNCVVSVVVVSLVVVSLFVVVSRLKIPERAHIPVGCVLSQLVALQLQQSRAWPIDHQLIVEWEGAAEAEAEGPLELRQLCFSSSCCALFAPCISVPFFKFKCLASSQNSSNSIRSLLVVVLVFGPRQTRLTACRITQSLRSSATCVELDCIFVLNGQVFNGCALSCCPKRRFGQHD